ncbi:MAG: phosphate/phosphite/phosphonate ABC transporter substrate-binding protein, partial [Anaerolineaceae bacterium]|nr:phosphate/phosphite/phosphonate ABC transporter substrate-binding protein [Anaerolineaceae bacterium]
ENETLAAFDRLAGMIFDHTGLFVEPFLFTDDSDVVEAMCSDPRRVHIASLNVFSYVAVHARGCADVELVEIRFDRPTFSGQILAHADSGIESLPDLYGKVFCRPIPSSLSGWLAPRFYLMRAGIDPDSDFSEIVDSGTNNAVVEGIYFGECDAGATFVDARLNIEEEFPDVMEVIKVIGLTDDIPNDGIQYHPGVSRGLRDRLNEILLSLSWTEDGINVLELVFGCEEMVKVDDGIYNAFRGVIEEVGISPQELLMENRE